MSEQREEVHVLDAMVSALDHPTAVLTHKVVEHC